MTITLPGVATDSQQTALFNKGFDKLPDELKVSIIAEAVKGGVPIHLKDFDKKINRLLAPFKGKALAIAQEEALKSNTFVLDIAHAKVTALSDELTRWYLPAPRFPEKKTSDQSTDKAEATEDEKEEEHSRLFFFGSHYPWRIPYRLSEQWMPVEAQGVRHLIVGYDVWVHPWEWDRGWDRDFTHACLMLDAIPDIFPKLETLEIRIDNPGTLLRGLPRVGDPVLRRAEMVEKLEELIKIVKKLELKKWMKHVNPTKKMIVRQINGEKGDVKIDFELKDKRLTDGEEEKVYSLAELIDFSLVEIT